MQLPPIDKSFLATMGIPETAVPIVPPLDYGVKPQIKKPRVEKPLATNEFLKMFGTRKAVMMTFIPQMITALAVDQAEAFVKYCRDNRLSEYKRHTREMRNCINEYNYELRQSYGKIWNVYQRCLARLRYLVEIDLFKCFCTFSNEASRQYVGDPKNEILSRVTFIRMLFSFAEDFDKDVDKKISALTKQPCHHRRNPCSLLISVLCLDIIESLGHKMEVTETMNLCVEVLANRCHVLADTIIAEDAAAQPDN